MAKLSTKKINYIKQYISEFKPLAYSYETDNNKQEIKKPKRESVLNIISDCEFFQKFGHERARISAKQDGDNSIITIEIYSQSPDKSFWAKHTISLEADIAHRYNLGI